MSKKKFIVFSVIAFLFASFSTIVVLEMLLRVKGYTPWKWRSFENEPIHHAPDPIRGWRNKPGRYNFPNSNRTGMIEMTFWPGGFRATETKRIPRKKRIILVGGSFTQGHGISDSETFAWKLHQRFPEIEFINLGTAAYGTYQSLLFLEESFRNDNEPTPMLVLYGFLHDHVRRNVAPWDWIKNLKSRERGYTGIPYCVIDPDGSLVRKPPVTYVEFPFRESLALSSFLEDLFMKTRTKERQSKAIGITEMLLSEMFELTRRENTTLHVVFLDISKDKDHFARFFQSKRMSYTDCTSAYYGTKEMMIPKDGHPNGDMNTIWSQCIEGIVKESIESPSGSS